MGRLISQAYQSIAAPVRLKPSEYAEEYFYLSPEASAEPGKIRLDRAPYQREMLDAIAHPDTKEVVIMSSAQIGKTSVQLMLLAYLIDLAPCPILWVAPTLEMAEATSKDRIAPMVRDCPTLRGKIAAPRARDSGNTLLSKKFPGGQLVLAGANSPASLASRPIQVVFIDEADRYPISAGQEGDPISLAKKRTTTFWNRMAVTVSTPTVKDASRIEKAFLGSDQRRFFVPCPHCGHEQHLVWENLKYSGKGTDKFNLDDLAYLCEACGAPIEEREKPGLLRAGRWQSTAPFNGIAGFHLSELYSPWKSWRDVALDFEAALNDPEIFQVWYNTSLGLPFEPTQQTRYDWERLFFRSEDSHYKPGDIPAGALLLTAGVDVQGDRLEVVVLGWGEGEQAFVIDYQKIYGDPLTPAPWDELDGFLAKAYHHPFGGEITVTRAGVDTGYQAHDCYMEIRKHSYWLALKGVAGDRPLISAPKPLDINWRGQKIKRGIKLHTVGVDLAKRTLLARCRIETPGPKFISFPQGIGADFCRGFAGSEKLIKKHRSGVPYYVWEPIPNVRNEPLDCMVYAYAAAIQSGLARVNWKRLAKKLTTDRPAPEVPEPEAAPERVKSQIPQPARRRPKGDSNWATQAGDFSRRRW